MAIFVEKRSELLLVLNKTGASTKKLKSICGTCEANIACKEHSQMKMKLLVVRRQQPGRLSLRVPDST